ncbi:MAG: hypothetical protein ACRDYY_07680 [Acidimicrobiales bacterium]
MQGPWASSWRDLLILSYLCLAERSEEGREGPTLGSGQRPAGLPTQQAHLDADGELPIPSPSRLVTGICWAAAEPSAARRAVLRVVAGAGGQASRLRGAPWPLAGHTSRMAGVFRDLVSHVRNLVPVALVATSRMAG